MATLTGINFSIILDKSQSPAKLRLIDTGSYPAGVPINLTGSFNVTQPDSLTATSPTVSWVNGALTQPEMELRLNTANTFQNGLYTIIYTINAPGYDETRLTKTVNLTYTPAVQVLTTAFDFFTPSLAVVDGTNYVQSGMTLSSILQTWSGTIISVAGTNRAISGSGTSFDVAYNGSYYDSRYDVELTANPQYLLSSTNNWVRLIDELVIDGTYYAEIPPSLATLLESLSDLKLTIDTCICGRNCGCSDCDLAKPTYSLAVSIYTHMVERGRIGDTAGLSLYVLQLQKLLNNCVTPTYVNTNAAISAYDWGTGTSGSVAWSNITGKPETVKVEWEVGDPGFPDVDATTYTDAALLNVTDDRVVVVRGGMPQFSSNKGDGDTYFTKETAENFLTFSGPLQAKEKIIILIAPL